MTIINHSYYALAVVLTAYITLMLDNSISTNVIDH